MEKVETTTLGQILENASRAVPDKTALVDGDRRINYRDLNHMTDALASSLSDIGLGKGDRVGIYMKSCIEFVVAFFALEKLGVIVAWVNPAYRTQESEFILSNAGAKGVFICSEWEEYDYLESLLRMKKRLPLLESIILVGEGTGDGVYHFDDLKEKGRDKVCPPSQIDTQNDLAMLIYTSGTTGKPKGAMITHYQSVRAGWEYSLGIKANSDDIFIGVLPMSHSYGCGSTLVQPILLQSTLVLMAKFDPESAFRIIEKEKITLQLAAPVHYILELNHKKRSQYDLSSLRAGLIAGQPAPEGLISRVEEEMGVYLTSFWGASEVGPGLGIMCPFPSPLGIREKYIGLPVADTQAVVCDLSTREELPDGEVGELALSGWHVMKGYWENPDETGRQIIDGRLFMGDLVSRDNNGYFSIYGRNKDLINRGGYKIIPHEIESLIIQHPKINEVCVVATPNPVLGENICACVIPKNNMTLSLDEMKAFLKGKVASHKIPNELCIMKDFPRLSGGVKLKKFGKGGIAELAANDKTREGYRG